MIQNFDPLPDEVKIGLKKAQDFAKVKPEGYLEEILGHPSVRKSHDGKQLIMPRSVYNELSNKYSPHRMPSMPQMAINLAVAGAQAFTGLVTGGPVQRSDDEQKQAFAICTGDAKTPKCECFDEARQRCDKCGCATALKSRLAVWHCPLGKW